SRRRHTSSKRDWSSDVCSSDLSRAGSHIQHLLPRLYPGESGEQNGVNAVAESLPGLDNMVSVLEIIQLFSRLKLYVFHVPILSLTGASFPGPPLFPCGRRTPAVPSPVFPVPSSLQKSGLFL